MNKFLGYYNYRVILTYIGAMAGFLGIIVTVERDVWKGLVCLMLAGLCDMFDGAVASTRKRNSGEDEELEVKRYVCINAIKRRR